MNLLEKINADLKTAMLAKDEIAKGAIRALKLAITKAETEKNAGAITDERIIQLVQKEITNRVDVAETYKQQNREDLVAIELGEAEILRTFLPEQVDEAYVVALVEAVVSEVEATTKKDMGKVMKHPDVATLTGKFDKKSLAEIIQSHLS